MAYQTGTATDPNDLLQKLVTFLVGNGWTQDMSQADGTGWRAHLHRGSVYVNLKSTTGTVNPWAFTPNPAPNATDAGLHIYLGTGFSGAANWNLQAGGPILNGTSNNTGCSMPLPTGSITAYHFFTDSTGDNVVVVVEKTTGIFTHLGWGVSVTKAGSWTGGPYFFAAVNAYNFASDSTSGPGFQNGPTAKAPFVYADTNSAANAYVRADVDAFTGKWLGCTGSVSQPSGGYTGRNFVSEYRGGTAVVSGVPTMEYFVERSFSTMTSSATLAPIRAWALRDAGGYSLLGTVPNIFYSIATDKGFSAGTEITIGPDTYKVFPNFAVRKVA